MTIVGTASVPHNGNLRKLGTLELPAPGKPDDGESTDLENRAYWRGYLAGHEDAPKSEPVRAEVLDLAARISQKIAAGKIGREQLEEAIRAAGMTKPVGELEAPPLPCPPWCVKDTAGGHSPSDRSTFHETTRTSVTTTFSGGPTSTVVDRHEVEVWAERFDHDPEQDGHPVVGFSAVHVSVDGYDSTGMTAYQAEQIGRGLLDAAAKVRAAASKPVEDSGNPATWDDEYGAGWRDANVARGLIGKSAASVWPPKSCPSWCGDADDPTGHTDRAALHPEDQYHAWHSGSEEEDSTYLSLERADVADPDALGADRQVMRQRLVLDMRQLHREVEPTIYIGHYDRGWERTAAGFKRDSHGYVAKPSREVKLTPAEARQLGERLVRLADLAQGNGSGEHPMAPRGRGYRRGIDLGREMERRAALRRTEAGGEKAA